MIIGFGNNVVSSLAADITASQTTIQVMPGAGAMFANLLTSDYANSSNPLKTYAKITLTDAKETVFEVCHLTAVNNDMLTVIRGQEGTTAKGWSLNDVIANFATRGSENQFVQIEELQSGHYVAGVAGGTENNLTLELPATYFVNGGVDWTLRTPLVVIPALNNTGASTLQLTMGGRVLGIFPLYKGNKSELSASDIIKDVPVLCVLDNTKTYFSVLNPLEIYLGSRYLQKDQNLADVNDKEQARQSLQLGDSATRNVGTTQGTVAAGDDSRITGALQKSQNGDDIPDKKQFARTIGAVT
ncbi:tail fiber protein, partial [Salmonella enterica]|nr:tail fiber protein [Salmonella enterica]EEF0800844.1 tail fiber protein [Salmonella enterica subsp. enterica serovar Newport]EDC2277772.1 tail fiber protein [Salmonella enterica]EEB0513995.1 tail fiber protein [Salmonella enterica]EGH8310498.1 tail fiber protein [Salmonella enterica]